MQPGEAGVRGGQWKANYEDKPFLPRLGDTHFGRDGGYLARRYGLDDHCCAAETVSLGGSGTWELGIGNWADRAHAEGGEWVVFEGFIPCQR